MLKIRTMEQYKSGTIVALEEKIYKVRSSLDLEWLGVGSGYLTVLEYQRPAVIGEYGKIQ